MSIDTDAVMTVIKHEHTTYAVKFVLKIRKFLSKQTGARSTGVSSPTVIFILCYLNCDLYLSVLSVSTHYSLNHKFQGMS